MSQADVGGAFGVSRAAISDMERGITKIDIPDLEKLCKILDVSILQFMPINAPVTPDEDALIMHYRQIPDDRKDLVLDVVRTIAARSQES